MDKRMLRWIEELIDYEPRVERALSIRSTPCRLYNKIRNELKKNVDLKYIRIFEMLAQLKLVANILVYSKTNETMRMGLEREYLTRWRELKELAKELSNYWRLMGEGGDVD